MAAGVRPAASALFGVHAGGAIEPFDRPSTDGVLIPGVFPPNNSAFALKLFDASFDSLCEIRSREEGSGRWNGLFGGGNFESSEDEIIRGVAFKVPHVISCFTAVGPNSDGVGEGIAGTRLKPLALVELG